MKPSQQAGEDVSAGEHHANGSRQLPWRLRLTNATFDIRPGEASIAWLLFFHFVVLATCHYVGKSVRNATYIDTVGATRLPYVYLLVALASVPVLLAYSRLTERERQYRLIVGWSLLQAAGLAVFYQLYVSLGTQAWVPVAFYVWLTIGFGVAVSQLWLFASQLFDPRQARRLFGFVGAGGLAGGVIGGQLARIGSHRLGSHAMLLVAAALMLGVAVIVMMTERVRRRIPALRSRRRPPRRRTARGGWAAVRSSRLLKMIALVMLLSVVVSQMVDLQFNWAIQEATTGLDQRTAVFGFFYSVMGLLAFVFQLFFTQRIHRRRGVGFAMRVMPTTVGLGTVALIAAATALPAVLLPVAWSLKLSESGLRHSLDQSTRELLFVPVSQAVRGPAKAFIDVFIQRAAKGAAALILLTVTFGFLSLRGVSWLTLVLVAAWIAVVTSTQREYVAAFRRGLKSEVLGEPALIQLGDVDTMTKLVEHLGSSDPRLVRHSLELLARHGHHRLVSPLLLHHRDAGVRRMTLRLLAEDRRSEAVPLVEMTLEDPEPEVRREAVQTLAAIERREAGRVMIPRLNSPHPNIRAAAAADLAASEDAEAAARARAVLGEMAVDADPAVRTEAARAVSRLEDDDSRELVVQLLYDTDLNVVRQAMRSAGHRVAAGEDTPIFVPILLSLTGNRRLKHEAREALVAHGTHAIAPLVRFMGDREEQIWVRRAIPKTIARLEVRAAAAALVEALDAPDAFLRSKVIEALGSIRRRHPEIAVSADVVRRQIRVEAGRYLRALADVWSVSFLHQGRLVGSRVVWQTSGHVPTFLQQLLAERMARSVENTFRLLELILNPKDAGAARRSFVSSSPTSRARALEFLDNTLTGAIRRDVFLVVDDTLAEDKLQQGRQLFRLTAEAPEETLHRLLSADLELDPDIAGCCLAAIHSVWSQRIEALYPELERLADTSPDSRVRESAGWAARTVRVTAVPHCGSDREELSAMVMPLIQTVTFLQQMEPFAFCTAEQILQLAEIAHDEVCAAGELVFERGEPALALYGVVEGEVEVHGRDEASVTVGRGATFGIRDILAGRLRTETAVATVQTQVLLIEAEDLFDLMSNNIEIVKGLIKRILESAEEGGKPPWGR